MYSGVVQITIQLLIITITTLLRTVLQIMFKPRTFYIEVNQNIQINQQSQLDLLPPTYPAMKLSTLLKDNSMPATYVSQNNNNNSMLTNEVSSEDPVIQISNYDNVVRITIGNAIP